MIYVYNKYHKIDTVDKNNKDYGNERDYDNDEFKFYFIELRCVHTSGLRLDLD